MLSIYIWARGGKKSLTVAVSHLSQCWLFPEANLRITAEPLESIQCPRVFKISPFNCVSLFFFLPFRTAWIWQMRMKMMRRYVPVQVVYFSSPRLTSVCWWTEKNLALYLMLTEASLWSMGSVLLSSLFSTKSSNAFWFLPATSCIFLCKPVLTKKTFVPNEDLTNPFPLVTTHSYVNRGVGKRVLLLLESPWA